MHPLYNIGPVELPFYGTIILFAFILGIVLMMFRADVYHYRKSDFVLAGLMSSIGLIVGSKIVFIISLIPEYARHWNIVKQNIPYAIYYALSGFVFYGGLIGVLLMLLLYCRHMDIPFLEFTNVVAPVIPFIHGIGRIGCFLGGCCYGIEYDGPLHIVFPYNEFVPDLGGVPRFPIQFVECAINLLIFAVLYYLSRKPVRPGLMLGLYLITYSVVRFSLEFLRGDVERGFFLNLSTSQWISLLLLPVGICLLLKKPLKKES